MYTKDFEAYNLQKHSCWSLKWSLLTDRVLHVHSKPGICKVNISVSQNGLSSKPSGKKSNTEQTCLYHHNMFSKIRLIL